MKQRFCLLCDNYRARGSLYCNDCRLYEQYKHTAWYHEILQMEYKQRRINAKEAFPLLIDHPAQLNGNPIHEVTVSLVRAVGRPKKFKEDAVTVVKNIFEKDETISVRKLTKAVNEAGINMSRETVRAIMKRLKIE